MLNKIHNLPHVGVPKRTPRFIVRIFEHKRIRVILGSNLALMVMAGALFPNQSDASTFNGFVNPTILPETAVNLTTERGLTLPYEAPRISQKFSFFHHGIDLTSEVESQPINPIMAGKVINIQHSKYDYGNAVIVDHGNELTTLYAHLSKILVYEGQEVTTKTTLGTMGATGHATGPHLHLEIRDHGRAMDPLIYLSSLLTSKAALAAATTEAATPVFAWMVVEVTSKLSALPVFPTLKPASSKRLLALLASPAFPLPLRTLILNSLRSSLGIADAVATGIAELVA
jgi:hypothetical protein